MSNHWRWQAEGVEVVRWDCRSSSCARMIHLTMSCWKARSLLSRGEETCVGMEKLWHDKTVKTRYCMYVLYSICFCWLHSLLFVLFVLVRASSFFKSVACTSCKQTNTKSASNHKKIKVSESGWPRCTCTLTTIRMADGGKQRNKFECNCWQQRTIVTNPSAIGPP